MDELVNKEGKIRARDDSLIDYSKIEFKCNNGHICEQSIVIHIEVSSW